MSGYNQVCVRSLASQDSIGPILAGMKARPDSVGLACEGLNNMFSKGQEELVSQALKHDLIPYLLSLLQGTQLPTLSFYSFVCV